MAWRRGRALDSVIQGVEAVGHGPTKAVIQALSNIRHTEEFLNARVQTVTEKTRNGGNVT